MEEKQNTIKFFHPTSLTEFLPKSYINLIIVNSETLGGSSMLEGEGEGVHVREDRGIVGQS